MTARTTPPFRADHVGSLLRPTALHTARDDYAAGRIAAGQLKDVEDAAIRNAVRMQEEIGLASATDGEFRREQWHADFLYSIPGIRRGSLGMPLPVYRKDGQITWTPNITEITGKIHLDEPIFGDHFRFLAEAVTTAAPKLTVPSPSMAHFRADLSKSPYTGYEEFRADVAATYAAVINEALKDKPADMAVTVHMCRGNYQSAWFSSGGYDFVAEGVFGGLAVDGLFLEYDDERSGSFEPLRFVPADQIVVLGLVTTKTPALESKDDLKRRVDEAAKYVDGDRLCLSGQCGFASTVEGNALSIDEERAKLDLIVQTAEEIWG